MLGSSLISEVYLYCFVFLLLASLKHPHSSLLLGTYCVPGPVCWVRVFCHHLSWTGNNRQNEEARFRAISLFFF